MAHFDAPQTERADTRASRKRGAAEFRVFYGTLQRRAAAITAWWWVPGTFVYIGRWWRGPYDSRKEAHRAARRELLGRG